MVSLCTIWFEKVINLFPNTFFLLGFFLFTERNMLVLPDRKYRNYVGASASIKGPQMSRYRQAIAQFSDLPLARLSNIICRCVSPALILSLIILCFENLILNENSGSLGRNRRNFSLFQIVLRIEVSEDIWNTSRFLFFSEQKQDMFISWVNTSCYLFRVHIKDVSC